MCGAAHQHAFAHEREIRCSLTVVSFLHGNNTATDATADHGGAGFTAGAACKTPWRVGAPESAPCGDLRWRGPKAR